MLSNTCKYGIRALSYIAGRSDGKKIIGIKKISEDLGLPTPFLAKILQQLVKNKILKSSKVQHCGFFFLKDPGNVALFDVILIIDGDAFFQTCVIHNRSCESEGKLCPVHNEFARIRDEITELFRNTSINDLAKNKSGAENIIF